MCDYTNFCIAKSIHSIFIGHLDCKCLHKTIVEKGCFSVSEGLFNIFLFYLFKDKFKGNWRDFVYFFHLSLSLRIIF